MSQPNEVRYTARSITPPVDRDNSPPPKRRAAASRSPSLPLPPPPPFPPKGVRIISSRSPPRTRRSASRSPPSKRHGRSRSPSPKRRGRSRSPSPKRRGRSRSPSPKKRGRSRSPPPKKRGRSRSPPPKKRGRSRSPSPNKRGRSRSPSPNKRGRSRSPSPKRRGRSRSRSRNRSRSGSRDEVRNPGNNLHVTGLSTRTTRQDLEKFFSKEGKVQNCHIVIDPRTKEPRGFAFVTMENVEDARRCIKYLHRTVLDSRLISVAKEMEKSLLSPCSFAFLLLTSPTAASTPLGCLSIDPRLSVKLLNHRRHCLCTGLTESSSASPTTLSAPTLPNHHRHRLLHCLHRPCRVIMVIAYYYTDLAESSWSSPTTTPTLPSHHRHRLLLHRP